MTASPHWLESLVREIRDAGRALVVCRSTASQREVLRALADAAPAGGAWTDVEVVTLRGLVASREPQDLLGTVAAVDTSLPERHPWRVLLEGRPGLTRLLRQHAARAHAVAATGAPLDELRAELRDLMREGWGRPPGLAGALALRTSPPADGCIAVGYVPGGFAFAGAVQPLDTAVLAALSPRYAVAEDPRLANPGPIPALLVADPSAEARTIAERALAAGGGRVLVLVAHRETEARVRAALARNGVAAADDDAIPLSRHSLAAVLAPLLPIFASGGTEPLDALDLLRLATDPVLSRTPPAGGVQAVPELGDEAPRASARHVRELVVATHRARAPLEDWIAILSELERGAAEHLREAQPDARLSRGRYLASARILVAQVLALAARASGRGVLADVAGLVADLGLSSVSDRLGHAMLGALRDDGFRPATEDDFDEALSGAVGSRRVDDGVRLLRYESYDGRTADRLLLADLHDKGIARAPAPDPFLGPCDLAVLGVAAGSEAVADRLAIARWAAARTQGAGGSALGVVTETDPSGRRVSAPVGLDLAFGPRAGADCFGLAVELPERADRAALAEGRGERDALSLQLDAEWARAGVAFDGAGASFTLAPGETLADQLERDLPRVPDDLRPLLGEAGVYPSASGGLPEGFTLSASRLRAFTNCLYKAFLESVLRLRAAEEPSEDLDPREVGTAVHSALQAALLHEKLRVPEADLPAHRKALLEKLRTATDDTIKDVAKDRGADEPEPLRLAREGLEKRWRKHWERFVAKRVDSVEHANAKARDAVGKRLQDLPEVAALVAFILPAITNKGDAKDAPKKVARAVVDCDGEAEQFGSALGALMSSNKIRGQLPARLATPEAMKAAQALLAAAAPSLEYPDYHPEGDLEVVATELAFGTIEVNGKVGPALTLPLGREPVAVRGSIDAVLRRRGHQSEPGFEIRDFKSGSKGSAVLPGDQAVLLLLPQTALYALVAERLGHVGKAKEQVRVERLNLDYVQGNEKLEPVAPDRMNQVATVLGKLLDRARDGSFPSLPHPRGCPFLAEYGAYCDFGEVCRIRPGYAPEPPPEEPTGGEEAGA